MTNKTKGKAIKISALCLDVAAPLIATATQFPIWVEKSSAATMSGLFLIFAMLSAIPFMKQIKTYFKSPSAWSMWCIIFVLATLVRNIIDQAVVICFVGLVANLAGAGLHKLGEKIESKEDAVTNVPDDSGQE